MFGFKSRRTRAIEGAAHFITKMLEPYGRIPAAALSDPYCIGFLQIVGVHVASQSLEKGGGMQTAMTVFDDALKLFAPNQARDVAQMLSHFRAETSPLRESYLGGRKDGDTYMGWKLLGLAPRWQGEAALKRLFERLRSFDTQSHAPRLAETPVQRVLPLPPPAEADQSPASPRWTPLTKPPQSRLSDDEKFTKLVENNIMIANDHAEIIRNKTEAEAAAYVKSIFDMYEVVWGVWNDPNTGIGMFPLKGDALLRQAMASGAPVTLKMSAVLCSAEDGMAARRRERG